MSFSCPLKYEYDSSIPCNIKERQIRGCIEITHNTSYSIYNFTYWLQDSNVLRLQMYVKEAPSREGQIQQTLVGFVYRKRTKISTWRNTTWVAMQRASKRRSSQYQAVCGTIQCMDAITCIYVNNTEIVR